MFKFTYDYILCFFYHVIVTVSCYYFTSFSFVTRILVGGFFGLLVMFMFQKQLKHIAVRDKVFADFFISDSLFDRFSEKYVYTKASILLFNLFYTVYFMIVILWFDILPIVSTFLTSLWTDSIVEAEETMKQSKVSIKSNGGDLDNFDRVFKKHTLNPFHLAWMGAMFGRFLYRYKNPEAVSQAIRCFKSDGTRAFENPIVTEVLFGMSKAAVKGLLFLSGTAYFVSDMYPSGITQATNNYFLSDEEEVLNYKEEEEIKKW